MKRSPPLLRDGMREYAVLDAFTKDQLMWIGACAMAYADAEHLLHYLAGNCLGFHGNDREVTSRVNGTDGLIAIIFAALKAWEVKRSIVLTFERTLQHSGFAHLKPYRDAMIHAALSDSESGIGHFEHGRKSKIVEVMLTPAALKRLYKRFEILKEELDELIQIAWDLSELHDDPAPDDPRKAQLEESIRDAISQCRIHQRRRLSLVPFPEFPPAPPQKKSRNRRARRYHVRLMVVMQPKP